MKYLYFTALLFICLGCHYENEKTLTKVMGYRPVYSDYESLRKVEVLPPQKLKNAGKIYIKDNYLFVNEQGEGVHIFDNSDKSNPKAIAYLAIPANQDVAIKGTTLYADNADDLVAIDISDLKAIKVTKRIEKSFPYPYFPAKTGVSFECADPSKGYVVRWEYTELINPKCRR
jgi:hypothetical protein